MFDDLGAGYGSVELALETPSHRVHSVVLKCYLRLLRYLKSHRITSTIPSTSRGMKSKLTMIANNMLLCVDMIIQYNVMTTYIQMTIQQTATEIHSTHIYKLYQSINITWTMISHLSPLITGDSPNCSLQHHNDCRWYHFVLWMPYTTTDIILTLYTDKLTLCMYNDIP